MTHADVSSMRQEFATIKIQRFKTPAGKPTCSVGIDKSETCQFLYARKAGFVPVCILGEHQDLDREGGFGFIEPRKDCAVWR